MLFNIKIWVKCGKCVILHKIDIKNVIFLTFSALKTQEICLKGLLSDNWKNQSPAFAEYKGALTENYILQSLCANGLKAGRYWSSGNRAEVDFLIQRGTDIIPVEVKADTNIRGRSLVEYEKRYSPALRIRFSMLNLNRDGNLINIPFFLADRTEKLCK